MLDLVKFTIVLYKVRGKTDPEEEMAAISQPKVEALRSVTVAPAWFIHRNTSRKVTKMRHTVE
jgi:hypothetical protein